MLARLTAVTIAALLAACTNDAGDAAREGRTPPAGPQPDVYHGVFPCENCPGVDTTLWLRADGTFFWRQQYLDDAGRAESTAHSLGRWQIDADGLLELRGAGPSRRLDLGEAGALLLRTPSPLEHRLSRAPGAAGFADRLRIQGIVTVEGGSATITECRTGLTAKAQGAALRPFLRQHRSLGLRSKPAFVEIEARFEWSDDDELAAFAVERYDSLNPNRTC